jgi:hypothetical protein
MRTLETKQHYFTNSGHIQQWVGCYCSVLTFSSPPHFKRHKDLLEYRRVILPVAYPGMNTSVWP